ncbi:MAG: SDR family oxidoreductase, partial [Nannocystaceae bacterium]
NLTACFLGCQAQIPAMRTRGQGSIVLTSTFVGTHVRFPQMAAYAASKAGLIGLVRTLAAEFGPEHIRVNALLPGGCDTAMGRQVADTPQAREHVAGLHALRRLATPQEIAFSAVYLLSEASSFTTGSALLADGGISSVRG